MVAIIWSLRVKVLSHTIDFSMGVNVDDTIDNGLADLKVGSWQELGKVFPSESFDKMYFSLSTGNTIHHPLGNMV